MDVDVKKIIECVGGKSNIVSHTHCMTRLRFILADKSLVQDDDVKKIKGVINSLYAGDQYQIVIGPNAQEVYNNLVKELQNDTAASDLMQQENNVKEKKTAFSTLLDIISSVFTPTLGLLAASGILKGLASLLMVTGVLDNSNGIYILLQGIGNTFFYFFPVVLGYTTAKKTGINPLMGIIIGCCLVNPAFLNIINGDNVLYTIFSETIFETDVFMTVFGIPVLLMDYSQTVIPVIAAVFLASYLEKKFRKIVPEVLRSFGVPLLTLLVTMVLTFIVVGPIMTWVSYAIGYLVKGVYDLSPILCGLVLGGTWQILVMFGVHWSLTPIGYNNFSLFGYDPIMCLMYGTPFATAGSVLGVMYRERHEGNQSLSLSTALTCFVGITEPALYGVTIPRKRPFIAGLIGGGIGGAIMGFFGSRIYTPLAGGIFALPNFIAPEGITIGFIGAVIAITAAFASSFLITVLTYKKEM